MPYADPEAKREYDRRYYRANSAEIKARVKQWKSERPGYGAEMRKAWREANPEYAREWYLANREQVITAVRVNREARLAENPERVRAVDRDRAARRRARQREAFVENIDALEVWQRDRGLCGICGEPADPDGWHLDHVVPIARGGEHSYANVQVTHPACNWRKAASWPK